MPAWIVKRALWIYFILAYALTWGGSAVHLALSHGGDVAGMSTLAQAPAALLVLLGPALAALAAAGIERGRRGLGHLLRPLLDWRVGWRWWGFVFAYPIVHHLAIAGIVWVTGGPRPRFFHNPSLPQGSIALALAVGIAVNLVRGFGEEVGWRGYALPRLQSRWDALAASLVLGVLWGFWHWHPANWTMLGPSLIWLLLATVPLTILYTWLYNHTRGSLLVAVAFHMWLDVSDYVVPLGVLEGDVRALAVRAALNWAITLLLCLPRRAKTASLPVSDESCARSASVL